MLNVHLHALNLVNSLSAAAQIVHTNPADTLGLVMKEAGSPLATEMQASGQSASLVSIKV